MAKGRQASGNPPTPRAPDKSGQSDCPTIEEKETSRYHAKQETDQRNERTWMCVQRRYRRERGPGYNLWKRCQVGRWDRKKNAALTDCALNKGDTRLLMAVRIPPNEMTGIPARTGHTERPDKIRQNGRRRCRHSMPGNGHTERPDDIRQNGHRRGSKKERAGGKRNKVNTKKEQAECKRSKVNEERNR